MFQKNILVVDDDPLMLVLIKTMLRTDYRVSTALNGHEAISLFRQEHFDLIITDMVMPTLDGNALAQAIRTETKIPIVLISASQELQLLRKIFASGSLFYLPKPFTRSSLLSVLHLALNNLSSGIDTRNGRAH